ncbi:hypothetical protein [Arthrobacter sp. ERGS1:01]|uniref:hypothetical protein n=1 Tax=Arthrobacter sp. ERGS1:01 TaxID=1704044 RepID=UPI000A484CA1|nr:hypothetical protein [Arthrobacter sp. ERGS1:01]
MTTLTRPKPAATPPPEPKRRPRNRRGVSPALRAENNVLRSIGIVLLWAVVAVSIAMLLWMVLQAFRDTRSILSSPWGMPEKLDVSNFVTAWTVSDFATATLNSVVTTAVSSFLCVAIAAPAAYYLSRVESRLTGGLSLYFILGLGIPAQVILIPCSSCSTRSS